MRKLSSEKRKRENVLKENKQKKLNYEIYLKEQDKDIPEPRKVQIHICGHF